MKNVQKRFLMFLCFVLVAAATAQSVLAATPTATKSAAPKATTTPNTKIEDLKDRLATKANELRVLSKKAVVGILKSVGVAQATIELPTKDIKIELVDDIPVIQYLKGKRTKLTVDDLDTGDPLVVFGTYDATLDILSAKYLFIQDAVQRYEKHLTGTVTEIDSKKYTITMKAFEGQQVILDIESTTKTNILNGDKQEKSGFSKITAGDRLVVYAVVEPKKTDLYSAIRILNLGTAGSPNTTIAPTPEPTKSSTSSAIPKFTDTPKATTTPKK